MSKFLVSLLIVISIYGQAFAQDKVKETNVEVAIGIGAILRRRSGLCDGHHKNAGANDVSRGSPVIVRQDLSAFGI